MVKQTQMGTCINCGNTGPTGEYCSNPKCREEDYAYIPVEVERDDIYLGKRIDDFLLVGTVGKGGFGKVYKALQIPVLMEVALKFLTNAGTKEMEDRFFREAKSLAMLKHPNVVRLNKFGKYKGKPYIAMEMVDNARSLDKEIRDRVRNSKVFTRQEVKHILQQVLNALGEAHSLDIVHRDIKPENILLQRVRGDDLFVRVLDFGLAKFTDQGASLSMAMGTPRYMAPEQFTKGDQIGPWTDLYALTVMTFELISGHSLFKGTIHEIIGQKLMTVEELFQQRNLELDPESMAFFKRGMATDYKERFQTTEEFGEALEGLLNYLEEHVSDTMVPKDLEELLDSTDWHKVKQGSTNFMMHNEETKALGSNRRTDVKQLNTGEKSPKGKGNGKGLWIAIVLVLVLAAGGGWVFFTKHKKGPGQERPQAPSEAIGKQPKAKTVPGSTQKIAHKIISKEQAPVKKGHQPVASSNTALKKDIKKQKVNEVKDKKTKKPVKKVALNKKNPQKRPKPAKKRAKIVKKVKKSPKKQTNVVVNKSKSPKTPAQQAISKALKLSGYPRIKALKACIKQYGNGCCKANKYLGIIYLSKMGEPEKALPYWQHYKACTGNAKERAYAASVIERINKYIKEQ